MSKRVLLIPFPEQKFELLQQLSSTYNCTIAKYRNKQSKIDYHIQTHILKPLPERTKQMLIEQIQQLSVYKQKGVDVFSKAYIQQSQQLLKIILMVRLQKAKTLKQAIQTYTYLHDTNQRINSMIKMAKTLMKMHRKRHPHGNISVSTIHFLKKNESHFLGMPVYTQLQRQITQNMEKEEKANVWKYPTLSGDIFNLGLVFLQICLDKIFPQRIDDEQIVKKLSQVKNPGIKCVISRMLADINERWSLKQVINGLQDWQNYKIPKMLQPEQFKECNLKLQIFTQISDMRLKSKQKLGLRQEVTKKLDNFQLTFTFVGGRTYVNIIFEGKGQYFVDLTEQIQKWKTKNDTPWLNHKELKQIIEDSHSIIRITPSGCLLLKGYCKIPQEYPQYIEQQIQKQEQQQIKSKPKRSQIQFPRIQGPFNKVCTIIGGKSSRKGFIISQWLMLTSAEQLQDLKNNEETLYIQTNEYYENKKTYSDVWIALQESQTLLPFENFCVISLYTDATLTNFSHIVKMIKNYSEAQVQQKIKREQLTDYQIMYELAGKPLSKGQIKFQITRFVLKPPKEQAFSCMTGEPLLLKLPLGEYAVIGIYSSDNKGIIFTDGFYWTLYSMMVKIHGEFNVTNMYFPFIFIECSELQLSQQPLPNLSNRWIDYFGSINGISKRAVEDKLQQMETQQSNNYQLMGILYYVLFWLDNRTSPASEGLGMESLFLRLSIESFSSHFKGRPNYLCAYLQQKLAYRLSRLSEEKDYKEQSTYFTQYTIEILKKYQFNPLLLMLTIKVHNEIDEGYFKLCKDMGFVITLRKIYQKIIALVPIIVQGSEHKMRYFHQRLQPLQTYSFSINDTFNFEQAIKRTNKSIATHDYNMIICRLDELLARGRRKGDETLNQKLMNLWKSAITAFMAGQCNMKQLTDFQTMSKRYFEEDGYPAIKESFRKKEQFIKRSQQ